MQSILQKPLKRSPIHSRTPSNSERQEPSLFFEIFQGIALNALGASLLAEAIDAANFSRKGEGGLLNIPVINPDPIAQIDPSRMFKPK